MFKTDARETIQRCYSEFLKSKELKPRYGQKLMIAAIARALQTVALDGHGVRSEGQHVCVVEAGTGTGKTVAYLLAVLPIARALGKKVVVSTATVALQEQIVFKDLPDLKRSTSLDFSFGLAKGRGRYLCLSKLDKLLAADGDQTIPLFQLDEAPQNVTTGDQAVYQSMMQQLASHQWEGDKDDWPEEIDGAVWSRVTTDHRQCSGRRCSFVRQCAFFRARDALGDLDCIVANHDLVLSDLALGGGAILPAPEETIYIFDEGHHLPAKALGHFASHSRIVTTSRWLGMSESQWPAMLDALQEATHLKRLAEPLEAQMKTCRDLLDGFQPLLLPFVDKMDRNGQATRYRFEQGVVPEDLEAAASHLHDAFYALQDTMQKCHRELESLLEQDHPPVPKDAIDESFSIMGTWLSRTEANTKLWQSYSQTKQDEGYPIARWITLYEQDEVLDFELVASPILASHTLDSHLWQRCCAAVVTSASLTALGTFEQFKLRSGSPENASYEVVPSPFDFQRNAVFRIPSFAVDANKVIDHTDTIVEHFESLVADNLSVLVLFASRRQMQDVYDQLDAQVCDLILMQGTESKQLLISQHKKNIDKQQKSILFGLASFAEGLDLPGDYCQHVIIAKIPFGVPDDPLDAAMAEWVEAKGGNAFMQLSVPDAAVKLLQACGRLLRTEKDTGTITLLDRRLVSKRYGGMILKSLPPFALDLPK